MTNVRPNQARYLKSLADEVQSQAQRVRDLIGERHWYSDGRHKEFLLAEVLRRHCPSSVLVAPGFVINPNDPNCCSGEQDILLLDTTSEAPVFHQGGLAVVFPRSVLASISVKTGFDKTEIMDAIAGLKTVRDVAIESGIDSGRIWCGAYFYRTPKAVTDKPSRAYKQISTAIIAQPARQPAIPDVHPSPMGPDALCSSGELLYRMDYLTGGPNDDSPTGRIRGFLCNGLATAMFLATLFDHLAVRRGLPTSDFTSFADVPDIVPMVPAEAAFKSAW